MRIFKTRWIAGSVAALLLVAAAPSRSSLESVLDALEQVHTFRGAAISPDGTRVAWVKRIRSREGAERLSAIDVVCSEGSTQEPGALVAYKADAGVVEEKIEEQRIAVVDVASGRVRAVSPANLYVYDYDWSPDGRSFCAEAAEGSGTNNYWIAQLYTVRADSGQTRSVWKPPLQIAGPRFSPDGKTIAVIHGIMSDEGSTGGDI